MVELLQGEYEKVKKYYEKKWGCDYFEFDFIHAEQLEVFREIDRFIWESKHQKTRYKNSYDGPVLVEITSWNNKEVGAYFDAFMYFLKDRSAEKCAFFSREGCCPELAERLRLFFDIKEVNFGVEADKTEKKIGFVIDGKEIGNVRG